MKLNIKILLSFISFIFYLLTFNYNISASSPNVLDLKEGWSLISLPVKPAAPFTAKTFLEEIALQGGLADKIARWDGNRYQIFVYGYEVNDFAVLPNKSYFLNVRTPTQLVIKGSPEKPSFYRLSKGWNAIGFSFDASSLNAGSLLQILNSSENEEITAHAIAQKLGGSSWQTLIKIYDPLVQKVESLGQNFSILSGFGVFIKTEKDLIWKP